MESKGVAKTKLLSETELNSLRDRVQKRFLGRDPSRSTFLANTFLGSYDELREDILRVVSAAESSVSQTRLRKLFHYTNLAVCSKEQLERASFGKDFLEVLERYVGKPEVMPTPEVALRQGSRKKWWVLGALLIASTLATMAVFFSSDSPKPWKEDFKHITKDSLNAGGWEILDYDSTRFSHQLWKDSMLTLWTLPGDYWVKAGEPKQISNMLVHKVEGTCFSVTMKVCNFYPSQVSQQVDIFLFDKNLNRETCLRFGLGFSKGSDEAYGKHLLSIINQEKGEVTPHATIVFNEIESQDDLYLHPNIWLRLSVEGNKVYSSVKQGFEWNSWNESKELVTVNFKPVHVGISAFQGWTNDDGSPKGADTIPAFIDYLIFEPCSGKK